MEQRCRVSSTHTRKYPHVRNHEMLRHNRKWTSETHKMTPQKGNGNMGTSGMLFKLQLETPTRHQRVNILNVATLIAHERLITRCSGRPFAKKDVPPRKHSDRERIFTPSERDQESCDVSGRVQENCNKSPVLLPRVSRGIPAVFPRGISGPLPVFTTSLLSSVELMTCKNCASSAIRPNCRVRAKDREQYRTNQHRQTRANMTVKM